MALKDIKSMVMESIDKIDTDEIKKRAMETGDKLMENAKTVKEAAMETGDKLMENAKIVKETAMDAKQDLDNKLHELDTMLQDSITEYNDAYTLMNDAGIQLFVERSRAVDSIDSVEELINSIANRPKSFDSDFQEIRVSKDKYTDALEFADRELRDARNAAGGAGAGLAAGASVAFMAPTAAMWVATTFGTASTGTAISALSGAAATNAALAWLGGGALTAGGGGIAAGNAFLAMAGPIGWTIAGASLLSSILILTAKKSKLNKEKNEEIESIKKNTETIREMHAEIRALLTSTKEMRAKLNSAYTECIVMFGKNYEQFGDEDKSKLGALVNNAKTLSALLTKTIEG